MLRWAASGNAVRCSTKCCWSGEGASRAMQTALEDAELQASDIQYINAHAITKQRWCETEHRVEKLERWVTRGKATDLVVQLSTGGSVHDGYAARLAVLDAAPDSCSLTCGTVNFGDDIFNNPMPFMSELYVAAQEREIVPEFEVFEVGHLWALERLVDRHGLPHGGAVHVDFVLGVPGALPGTPAALHACLAALPEMVTSWSATGIGRGHLPVLAAALAAGGHARVGMEDNIVFARGQVVQHNAELVTRAAEIATLLQRPPLTTGDARALLGITPAAEVPAAS